MERLGGLASPWRSGSTPESDASGEACAEYVDFGSSPPLKFNRPQRPRSRSASSEYLTSGRLASRELPPVDERAAEDADAEGDDADFSLSEHDDEDEEEEHALTVAARLGCMLLENKAELEAQIEDLLVAVEEHRSEAEDLRVAVRDWRTKYTVSMETAELAHNTICEREAEILQLRVKIEREMVWASETFPWPNIMPIAAYLHTAAEALGNENKRLLEQMEAIGIYVRELEDSNAKKASKIDELRVSLQQMEQSRGQQNADEALAAGGECGVTKCVETTELVQRMQEERRVLENRQRELENELKVACYELSQAHRLIEELTGQVAEYQQAVRELEGRLEAKEAAREEHVLESLATQMLNMRLQTPLATKGDGAVVNDRMPMEAPRPALQQGQPLLSDARDAPDAPRSILRQGSMAVRQTPRGEMAIGRAMSMRQPATPLQDQAMYDFFGQLQALGQSVNNTPNATPSRHASFVVKGPHLTIQSEGTPGPSQLKRGLSFAVLSPKVTLGSLRRDVVRRAAYGSLPVLASDSEDDGTSKTPPVADRARASSVATEEGNDESAVTPTKGAASGSTHGNTGIGSTSSSIKRGRTFRVRGYQRQSSLDSPLATPISEEGIGASASMNEPVPGRVQDTARDDEIIQLVSLAKDERARANLAEQELIQTRNQLERFRQQAEEERLGEQVRANELAAVNQRLQQQTNEMAELLAQLQAANSQRLLSTQSHFIDAEIGKVLGLLRNVATRYAERQMAAPDAQGTPDSNYLAAHVLEMCERTSDALEEVDEALTADSARAGAGADPCAGVTAVGQRVHASVAAFGTAVSCMLMSAEALASRCRTHGVTSQLESRAVVAERSTTFLQSVQALVQGDASECNVAAASQALAEAIQGLVEAVTHHLGDQHRKQQEARIVDREMESTSKAVTNAAKRIQEMLDKARASHTACKILHLLPSCPGVQRDIDDSILGRCAVLMQAVNTLIDRATAVQKLAAPLDTADTPRKAFYKKDHRWTDGLVSAAQAVGWCVNVLVDTVAEALSSLEAGEGKVERLVVSCREVAASTVQLVTASWAKRRGEDGSVEQKELEKASKAVSELSKQLVTAATDAAELLRKDQADNDIALDGSNMTPRKDFNLSVMNMKRREMELQVRILGLENQLDKERKALLDMRRSQYK